MHHKYELSVIAPCYNEALNIPVLVGRLQNVLAKKNIRGEIVLVDDASRDNTREIVENLQTMHLHLKLVCHKTNRGIAAAWKSGIGATEGVYVCFIDADLQNLPEDVWRLYREITFTNSDFVSGWRNHIEGSERIRGLVSRVLNWILNFAFNMNLRDNKSGFAIARKPVMEHVLEHHFTYRHPQTFIAVSAHAKGYSIRQIETLFDRRRTGMSYIAGASLIKNSYYTFLDVLKGVFEFRFTDNDDGLQNFLAQQPRKGAPPAVLRERGWRGLLFRLYAATFPLHHWMITRRAVHHWEDLEQSQWFPPHMIKLYQERRLRQLIHHVYHHVHFYRDTFDGLGLRPEDIRTIEDLQKLPIIDKQVVRENLHLGLMSNSHDKRKLQKTTTSGSTGEPFFTYLDKSQLEMKWAATLRSMRWTGYRFGDRQLRLWHKHLGLTRSQVWREIVDAKISRRAFIPAYEMDEAGLEDFMRAISNGRPTIIDGYAESFSYIAKYLKYSAYMGHKPTAIMCSGQTLPEESRRIIEEAFGCKVFDKYGAREFGGGLAYECEHGQGHHVVAECIVIEIIKDGKPALPGEVAEVVITDLTNFSVPLIRYRIGDLAEQIDNSELCLCGRGLPRIGKIEGRIQSVIIGANGTVMPGTFFSRLFAEYEHAVRQFQILQERPGGMILRIVKAPLWEPMVIEQIMRELYKHLGADMRIEVEFIDQVGRGRTGKRQYVLSSVPVETILTHVNG